MIQIEREKLEKVLDALEDHDSLHGDTTQQAITIIKDVLAQQEPTAIGKSVADEEAYWRNEMLSGD